ncbi:MAG: two-component regulator propeller domain-containing protein [Ignavibacteriaceae bacterium]|jgi:hypothetical protein
MGRLYKLFFFLLLSLSLQAQNPEWISYNISVPDLPFNCINAIAIDSAGNKWIGTTRGLAKFDDNNWTIYNKTNSVLPNYIVRSIAIDGLDNKWIGFYNGGLAKFNDTTGFIYTTSNSGLPNDQVNSIATDRFGNAWIGTGLGLAKFDGTNWIVYNKSNSGLSDDFITTIVIDNLGNKWIGTGGGGISKFDNTNWTVFNSRNSGFPGSYVYSIALDSLGNKWIGTSDGGLVKFDDKTWEVFNKTNSGLPENRVLSLAIDGLGNKWIGTWAGGLTKFDDTNWVVYKSSNSGLPNNDIWSIAIDVSWRKWIGTSNYLAVYSGGDEVPVELVSFSSSVSDKKIKLEWVTATERNNKGWGVQRKTLNDNNWKTIAFVEGKGTSSEVKNYKFEDVSLKQASKYQYRLEQIDYGGSVQYSNIIEVIFNLPNEFELSQNYPNPFNPSTIISWQLAVGSYVTLKVYDVLGNEVATLVNENQSVGIHQVEFQSAVGSQQLACGIYFYQLRAGNFVQTRKMIVLK